MLPPQPPQAFSIRGLRLYFPALEPWVSGLPSSPPSVGPWGATRCSACPVLCHSESGPLGLSVHECRAAGSASGQTACPFRPTLRQSRSRPSHASPLRPGARLSPSYWSGCMFPFYLPGVGLPCRSIFCQFSLCEEVHCVYLHRHLGSREVPPFLKKIVVIQLQLYAFSPHPSTLPETKPPPSPTSTLPLDSVHVSFIVVPVIPSPHCPVPTPP